jgi:hypothetical protein
MTALDAKCPKLWALASWASWARRASSAMICVLVDLSFGTLQF